MEKAILLVIFNRPNTTEKVFDAIRQARPKRLYVAADGPRKERQGEDVKCMQARKIVERVDWDCDLKTLFREENLGCGKGVSQAITWFFEHEQEGIILEDDCLPSAEFFPYCEQMLDKYRDEPRINFISGRNYLFNGEKEGKSSYYFSAYNHVWGWAAWRRSWQCFDLDIAAKRPLKDFSKVLRKYFDSQHSRYYWQKIYMRMRLREVDSWAWPYTFCLWYHGGLSIIPNYNLIENIGFSEEATHTKSGDSRVIEKGFEPILPLIHNSRIEQSKALDDRHVTDFMRIRISIFKHSITYLKYQLKRVFSK